MLKIIFVSYCLNSTRAVKTKPDFIGRNLHSYAVSFEGQAHCIKCLTPIVSDSGIYRNGTKVYYYACKKKKRGL